MVPQGFTVDLEKPIVFQVGHLGEDYQEWVHQPIVSKKGPRFFESDFLEFLTKTHWWAIPLIWLPVVCWFSMKSFWMGHTPPQIALILVIGIFIWTFFEYSFHRFLFHIKTKSYWGNTMHYLLHGCHHKHPMDRLRLVYPPAATTTLLYPWGQNRGTEGSWNRRSQQIWIYVSCLCLFMSLLSNWCQFWNLAKLISTQTTCPALFAGILLGYVMYDLTHYYLHHSQPTSTIPRNLKRYHLNHHFREQNKGFGVIFSLWDKVFGTLPPSKASK